mmetsp:Transcript_96000/g.248258  ORF Transcript_96000/g.248258 Transcript_96000/m.248258 type:complete len:606 (-) Transcript_96000:3275-5092(-)
MLQDEALVGGKVRRDRCAVEVGIQQQLRLRVRVVELVLLDLHAQRLGKAAQGCLLARAHRHRVELGGSAQDVHQPAALRALVDAPGERLDGRVPDVVVGRDEAQVGRSKLHIVLDAAAAEALQALHSVLNYFGEVVAEVLVRHTLEAVVVGVLRQPAVVERPGEPVDGILLVLDGLHHDLRIHVVRHPLIQVALHRQRLVDELLVVLLLGVLRQQHAHTRLINTRSARTTHHLQHVMDRIVNVPVLTAIKPLRVHDDAQVRQHRHTPAQLLRGNDDLDRTRLEKPLNHSALRLTEALMQEANAVLQGLLQRLLAGGGQVRLHGVVRDMEEALRLVVSRSVQQEVNGGHARLLAVGHEHNDGLVGRVMLDGLIDGPAHRQESRGAVVDVETLDHHLKRDGSHVRREVEQAGAACADPLADIASVGQRGRQGHDTDRLLDLHGDVPHARDHSLQSGADVAVKQMQLIDDEEAHLLHALTRLPSAAHQVPLLRSRDHDVRLLEDLDVGRRLAHELGNLEAHDLTELVRPLVEALLARRRVWGHVNAALHRIITRQHADDCELGADNLSAGGWSADEAVVVRGVERAERLCLNGVEDLQASSRVQALRV